MPVVSLDLPGLKMITLSPARHSDSCRLDDRRMKFPFPTGERNFPLLLSLHTGSGAHPEGEIGSSFRRVTSSEVWNLRKYHLKRHFQHRWKIWCVSTVLCYLTLEVRTVLSVDMPVTIYQSIQTAFRANFDLHYRFENLQFIMLRLHG